MWSTWYVLLSNRRIYQILLISIVSLILVTCQTGPASEVEKTQSDATEVTPLTLAYQIQQEFPLTIQVTSTSIKHTGYLKKDFTCEGDNLSPQLTFTNVPSETQSLAVIVDDIDAEEGALAHWLLWAIPPDVTDLDGGISGSGNLPVGALEGVNGYGQTGWKGPCPPPRRIYRHVNTGMTGGHVNTGITSHFYQINVYALDSQISASAGSDREEVLGQIDGHVIAGGFVLTRYLSSIVIRE